MPRKTVLIAGASGLVGYSAMQHFAQAGDCEVTALSRRHPGETFGARFVAADLTDATQCAQVVGTLPPITHLVYAALYEQPGLIAGWQADEQIRVNDRMLRNLMEPLLRRDGALRHVSLLQGTKAYGVHVRPMRIPAREGRSEARDIPNFYWQQEDFLRQCQRGQGWGFTVFRPVLIVGYSQGSAMNLIPAIGVYAAIMKARGLPLHYPGGPARVGQVVDAGLLARCIAWAGDSPQAHNGVFNVANGDVYSWQNVWPAIADACGMPAGEAVPMSLQQEIAPCEDEWAALRRRHGLVSPDLKHFVGYSFEYADYQMGYGRREPIPPSYSSTNRLHECGFHEVMDSEAMFAHWFSVFRERRLLP